MIERKKSLETESTQELVRPHVVKYENYRSFLKDFYLFKKSLRDSFSYRLFAMKSGLKSPNYLQLVIQGKRNLSVAAAKGVTKALDLSGPEKQYFLCMVELANAESDEDRQRATRAKLKTKAQFMTKALPEIHKDILSSPFHLLIRELVCLEDFQADGEWISKKLRRIVSPDQARDSLELLNKGQYIRYENSHWIMTEPSFDLGHEFGEALVLKAHIDTLKMWTQLLEGISKDSRELGLLNIPINSKKIPEFKQRIRDFQDEIIGWLEDEKDPDSLVQLGSYLIPLTTPAPT